MELIEEYVLPSVIELVCGITAAVEPSERGEFLSIERLLFGVTHVALVAGLRSEDATVVFEVEFVLPRRDADLAGGWCCECGVSDRERAVIPRRRARRDLLLDALEVGERCAELFTGSDFVGLHPVQSLIEHGARWSAAMVADAEEIHHVAHAGSLLCRSCEVMRKARGIDVLVCVVVWEVGEDFAAVGRLPPEELHWELVGVVPGHLLRDEVVDAGALVDLRELPVVTKGVRVPSDLRGVAVELLEGGLANEKLADE